jgi:TPR repeat protein
MISLATAITLTGWSKRTLWRRIADGRLARIDDSAHDDKAKIHLDAIKPHICIPLAPEDCYLVEKADAGNVEAQTDLALIFLSNDKSESAVYWLKLAAKQNERGAMHLLGRCYIDGNGLPKNQNLGIMWIAKAAAHGHVISQGQIRAICDSFTGNRS